MEKLNKIQWILRYIEHFVKSFPAHFVGILGFLFAIVGWNWGVMACFWTAIAILYTIMFGWVVPGMWKRKEYVMGIIYPLLATALAVIVFLGLTGNCNFC